MMKKYFIKSLVGLLTILMIVGSFPVFVVADSEDTVAVPTTLWTSAGNYNTEWYSEASSSYEIKTAAELAGVAYLSQNGVHFTEKTIYITADIDLGGHNWSGIGTVTDVAFEGTIVGKKDGIVGSSVTIRNLISANANQSYMGFIRRQSAGGIQNIIFEGAYIVGKGYHAVACGDVRLKSATATYSNITVKNSQVKDTVSSASVSGLLFGCVNLWGRTVTMSGLNIVDSSVTSMGAEAAAMVGRATWGTLTIQNTAVVDCEVTAASLVGGLIGWSDMSAIAFDRCFASGVITAHQTAAGGFLGYSNAANVQVSISNCQSDGIVQVENDGYSGLYIGVLVESYLSNVVFDKCLATGISRSKNIYAWIGYNGVGNFDVSNCYSNSHFQIAGSVTPTFVDFVTLDENATKAQLNTFDFNNVWLYRNGKHPVLSIVNGLVNDKYAEATLGWFDPFEKTKAFHITTESQLFGLGKLSPVVSPFEYQFWISSNLLAGLTDTLFDETFLNEFEQSKETPAIIGFQTRDNQDGTYDIRFVALLDNYIKYSGAGFDFVLKGETDQYAQVACEHVYASINADDKTIYTSDYGGGYFFCYEIRGLEKNQEYLFEATCYTQSENETKTGVTLSVALSGNMDFDVSTKNYEETYGLDRYTQIVISNNCSEVEELIANELQSILSDRWGCSISIVTDRWSWNQKNNEIIIGDTGRSTATSLEEYNYTISSENGNLLISAGSSYGLRVAADKLYKLFGQNNGVLSNSLLTINGDALADVSEDASSYYISNRQGDVRVMSFNIYGWDGYGGVDLRTELQKETIAAYLPDVICFQEFENFENIGYRTQMTQQLSALEYVEVDVGHTDGTNSTPLFYNSATVRLKDENSCGYLLYSGANDVNSKSLTWAVFEENKEDGKSFAVVSTHFMWDEGGVDHTATRVSNAQELLGVISVIQSQYGSTLPIIVGGDLNCTKSSQPITTLMNGGLDWFYNLADVKQEYGSAGYPTYNSDKGFYTQYKVGTKYTDNNITQNNAIDYLFGTGNMTVETYITITDYFARCSSDHAPKIADITLNDPPITPGMGTQNDDLGSILT